MRLRNVVVAATLLTAAQLCASAEVSLKNGNFFTGNEDIVYPGGFEPKIERVYNSKTSYKGIFGNGWGNEYEVYLEVAGDGSVVVHEYGGGADNRFDSPSMTPAELGQAADQIVAAAKTEGDITGVNGLADYRIKLLDDAAFRDGEWRKYIGKKVLTPRVLPDGTKLISERFSYQTVVVIRTGYRRDMENGRTEIYGKDGKLRQISDKNGNYLTFAYDVRGQITLRDDAGRSMVLSLNERGLVTRLEGSYGQTWGYKYNDRDELIFAKDNSGGEYAYEYDAVGRHNLTKIKYSDGTVREITYYPRDQYENVKSVRDRDGTLTEYAYDIDKTNKRHYTVSVKVIDPSTDAMARPKVTSTSSYEYINMADSTGEEYTARMITVLDGDRTDTTYNIDGLPTRIVYGGETTSFVYDSKGHVLQKKTTTETTDLTYDPTCSKVNFARISENRTAKIKAEGHFVYDDKCNLLAASSLKKSVKLQYDTKGRISEVDSNDGARIAFEYNVNSKPVKISVLEHKGPDGKMVPVHFISVTYTDAGEIAKVDAMPPGREAALEVTTAFQELLDLIKPAGVNLSF